MGCSSVERVVMGGMYRHYSVIQAGWNVFQCSSSAFFLEGEEWFLQTLVLKVLPHRGQTV